MIEVLRLDIKDCSYPLPESVREISFLEHSGREQLMVPGVSIDPRDSTGYKRHDYQVFDMSNGTRMMLKSEDRMTISELALLAMQDYQNRLHPESAQNAPLDDRLIERVLDNLFGIEMPPEPILEQITPIKQPLLTRILSYFK